MTELTEMKGQELVDVKEVNNELEFIFKNNTYVLKIVNENFVLEKKVQ